MDSTNINTVQVVEAPGGAIPRCPACKKKLDRVWSLTKGLGIIEQRQILMCPHCEAFLGYGAIGR